MVDSSASLVVAIFAIGMGLSFWAADWHSPTSRALALALNLLGLSVLARVFEEWGFFATWPLLRPRLSALSEAGTLAAGFEWILRVGRTQTSLPEDEPRARTQRVAQLLAVLYGAVGVLLPALRAVVFEAEFRWEVLAVPAYYVFAVPLYGSLAIAGIGIVLLFRAELDPAEGVRLNALALATPFWVAGFLVPGIWGPVNNALGQIIFLAGAFRHQVMQGQRGQFLARFLSPQVAHVVRERGLSSIMQQNRVQLSVVACDLRGFTAFTERAAPKDVMQLLRDYYDSIGAVVTECGGSIKDFAGDGILCLVGAPIAYPDHAERAVAMAITIRDRGTAVLDRWRDTGLELGIGIGIASGFVTVGAIGSSQRLEYAAVGAPVNLAARLCSRAESGQVLADLRTVGLVGEADPRYRFENLGTAELKGFARPLPIFAVNEKQPR